MGDDMMQTESDQKFWIGTFFTLGFFLGMAAGAIGVGILTGLLA